MRVLWLCNIMLPAYARHINAAYSNREGWLSGCYDRLKIENEKSSNKIELGVCFPDSGDFDCIKDVFENVNFYSFHEDLNHPEVYDANIETELKNIVDDFKPDVIHIFGTEFPHCLAMVRICDDKNKILIGMQGVCKEIADEYMAHLPGWVQNKVTFRDFLKKDSVLDQQKKFIKRAENEKKALEAIKHVTGRTKFDYEAVKKINPSIVYYSMNETMRNDFYNDEWDSNKTRPHSIFVAQGDYPIKGLHFVLDALKELTKRYEDAHLYIAGNSIIGSISCDEITKRANDAGTAKNSLKRFVPTFFKETAYGRYLRCKIKKEHLENHVTCLGRLSANQMKEEYLGSSVFVCASYVENSPNSLGEAMLLGMPIVVSNAGGIPSMVDDKVEALVTPKGDYVSLFKAVSNIWDNEQEAVMRGKAARKRALTVHDAEKNFKRLMEIYNDIFGEGQDARS